MSGQMTELDAVNEILLAVGDSPVQSLQAGTYIEAIRIKQILQDTSRKVQTTGWWFNQERDLTLLPDVIGEIKLAQNVITAEVKSDNDGSIIQRGNKLYNRKERSYLFKTPVVVNQIIMLEWDELPQVAREYITAFTAYEYNSGTRGLQDIKQDLQIKVQATFINLRAEDTRAKDVNMLQNTRAYNIAFRNRRR